MNERTELVELKNISKKYITFSFNLKKINHTDPSPSWGEVLVFAENCVEDKKNCKSWVVGDDSLGAGELSIVHNIQPGGKEKDSWNTIKHSLEQQEC